MKYVEKIDSEMSSSYKVSSSSYGGSGNYAGYPNYAYNGHEMTEYSRQSGQYRANGTGNKVGYQQQQQQQHRQQQQYSGNGNGAYAARSSGVVDDDDDEYERGHWGSKAEFILSCIGFSVSKYLYTISPFFKTG